MIPLGRSAPPPRRRGPLIAVAIATVVVVPFVIRDMASDGADVATRSNESTTTAAPGATAPAAVTTTTVPGTDPDGTAPPVTVLLDPKWASKGTSRYSETDEQTQTRINRESSAITTLPPPTAPPTTGPKKTTTTTTIKAPVRTTAPPVVTQPPATEPPATAPPATDPPPPTDPPAAPGIAPAVGGG